MANIIDGQCTCKDCEVKRENEEKHLNHPFYAEANQYRETIRREQVLKGAAKYPKPFNPADWTAKELLAHAMQENVDQAHYIYGLYEKLETLETELVQAKKEAEYWRLRAVANAENIEEINKTKGANVDARI